MRVFIFEHICGGGLARIDLRASLARKGGAMLAALVEDFVAAGVQVVTSLDRRATLTLRGAKVQVIEPGVDFPPIFDHLAKSADAALVVAPEFDRLLESWCRRLENLGVRSLGCQPQAVALVGDKLALARHLAQYDVPTPATARGLPVGAPQSPGPTPAFPFVAKPRYGAGCEDTFICRQPADLAALPPREDWIIQPWIHGLAASCAFVVHGQHIRPLRAGQQFVNGSGRLAYQGGRMPLPPDLEAQAVTLGKRALASVPGLGGYVGVDLVLGETPAGNYVIEINPRPTVAFVGLRRLCRTSLAAAILSPEAPLEWDPRPLRYDASGQVEWEKGVP